MVLINDTTPNIKLNQSHQITFPGEEKYISSNHLFIFIFKDKERFGNIFVPLTQGEKEKREID